MNIGKKSFRNFLFVFKKIPKFNHNDNLPKLPRDYWNIYLYVVFFFLSIDIDSQPLIQNFR